MNNVLVNVMLVVGAISIILVTIQFFAYFNWYDKKVQEASADSATLKEFEQVAVD